MVHQIHVQDQSNTFYKMASKVMPTDMMQGCSHQMQNILFIFCYIKKCFFILLITIVNISDILIITVKILSVFAATCYFITEIYTHMFRILYTVQWAYSVALHIKGQHADQTLKY